MTPEKLRAIVADAQHTKGSVMTEWDKVRAKLLSNHRSAYSDLPRQMFESNILEPLTDALEGAADEIARLRAALKPFAEVASEYDMRPSFADDVFTVNLGLMNGNVTQAVIHRKLNVGDFRRARAALNDSDQQTERGK